MKILVISLLLFSTQLKARCHGGYADQVLAAALTCNGQHPQLHQIEGTQAAQQAVAFACGQGCHDLHRTETEQTCNMRFAQELREVKSQIINHANSNECVFHETILDELVSTGNSPSLRTLRRDCVSYKWAEITLPNSTLSNNNLKMSHAGVLVDCQIGNEPGCAEIYYSTVRNSWCMRSGTESPSTCHQVESNCPNNLTLTSATDPNRRSGCVSQTCTNGSCKLKLKQANGTANSYESVDGPYIELEALSQDGGNKIGIKATARTENSKLGSFERIGHKATSISAINNTSEQFNLSSSQNKKLHGCDGEFQNQFSDDTTSSSTGSSESLRQ